MEIQKITNNFLAQTLHHPLQLLYKALLMFFYCNYDQSESRSSII